MSEALVWEATEVKAETPLGRFEMSKGWEGEEWMVWFVPKGSAGEMVGIDFSEGSPEFHSIGEAQEACAKHLAKLQSQQAGG